MQISLKMGLIAKKYKDEQIAKFKGSCRLQNTNSLEIILPYTISISNQIVTAAIYHLPREVCFAIRQAAAGVPLLKV